MSLLHERARGLKHEFRLGDWLVQPDADRIARGETTIHMRARLMDVLVCLAASAGEVVSKDDILAAVWGQKFLAESVLTRTITELRQALGDDPHEPRYIETIVKRGYRLVAPVEVVPAHVGATPPPHAIMVLSYWGARTLLDEGETVIGRAPNAGVRVDALAVSRRHARIVVAGSRAWVEDLGSKNGTRLDGAALIERTELVSGARIEIGPATLVFRVLRSDGTTQTDASSA
jgi:DNA-binding winged helix-turn-helix (wHTH) protein